MIQGALGLILFIAIVVPSGAAESLPIAPRRNDDLDQVPKVIFASPSGIDPKEGLEAQQEAANAKAAESLAKSQQAAPLKTVRTTKVDEKVKKLKETSAHGKRKSASQTATLKKSSQRKPAASKGLPKKKLKR